MLNYSEYKYQIILIDQMHHPLTLYKFKLNISPEPMSASEVIVPIKKYFPAFPDGTVKTVIS